MLTAYSYSLMYYLPIGANSPYLKATSIKKSTIKQYFKGGVPHCGYPNQPQKCGGGGGGGQI